MRDIFKGGIRAVAALCYVFGVLYLVMGSTEVVAGEFLTGVVFLAKGELWFASQRYWRSFPDNVVGAFAGEWR